MQTNAILTNVTKPCVLLDSLDHCWAGLTVASRIVSDEKLLCNLWMTSSVRPYGLAWRYAIADEHKPIHCVRYVPHESFGFAFLDPLLSPESRVLSMTYRELRANIKATVLPANPLFTNFDSGGSCVWSTDMRMLLMYLRKTVFQPWAAIAATPSETRVLSESSPLLRCIAATTWALLEAQCADQLARYADLVMEQVQLERPSRWIVDASDSAAWMANNKREREALHAQVILQFMQVLKKTLMHLLYPLFSSAFKFPEEPVTTNVGYLGECLHKETWALLDQVAMGASEQKRLDATRERRADRWRATPTAAAAAAPLECSAAFSLFLDDLLTKLTSNRFHRRLVKTAASVKHSFPLHTWVRHLMHYYMQRREMQVFDDQLATYDTILQLRDALPPSATRELCVAALDRWFQSIHHTVMPVHQ